MLLKVLMGTKKEFRSILCKAWLIYRADLNAEQLAAARDLLLSSLDRDLQVYVLADKYGIPVLKEKAARHFGKELEDADSTLEIFSIIQSVYSMTVPQDRLLRDIVIAYTWCEVQHWITNENFMEMARIENNFSADLLVHTVQEDKKKYEAALATIKHPGYCEDCGATMVLQPSRPKRKTVIKRYCARCEPDG